MHELMHGLGPHNITVGGKATTVRQELKDTYSAIEEAKADVSGLWALQQLVDKGTLPKDMERTMYTTFLASMFRSIRFGINEAHGKGVAVQLNYFLDQKAVTVNADGTFVVKPEAIKKAIASLTGEIMTLQAEGLVRQGAGHAQEARRRPAGSEEGAGPADGRAGRHRAAVRDRRGARRGQVAGRRPARGCSVCNTPLPLPPLPWISGGGGISCGEAGGLTAPLSGHGLTGLAFPSGRVASPAPLR